MKQSGLFILLLSIILSSCSSQQFGAATTGSTLGGIFGSSVGGIIGGYRGHRIGTIAGMTAGAAIGIAATTPRTDKSETTAEEEDYIEYEKYTASDYQRSSAHYMDDAIYVERVSFADANNNRYLEPNERGAIVLEIYNRGSHTLYHIIPKITCNNKHVKISPTAIVERLAPNQGFRYRAEILADKRLKNGTVRFDVAFNTEENDNYEIIKSFSIRTLDN